jgi:uncharacterized protein (TIGR03437 family)
MRRRLKRWAIAAGGLLVASSASGYYHFVHFFNSSPPYAPVLEKFDLSRVPDRTVRFYIAREGPAALAPGDSFESVISQIRAAAAAWNEVPTSELRLAFGGLAGEEGRAGATPAIDVLFDEIPPGLIALGGPTTRGELAADQNGSFIPITRSVVILNRDLSGQRSASEAFFLTAVHEIGHALGLQHTLTSSVMSTSITRATSKARPLAADDLAGISLLYPAAQWRRTTASIAGRVTLAGNGVHLASVVAISPQGAAVSALTNPDGTYRIEGLPPGTYYVYAHPLPPPIYGEVSPANIVLPRDAADTPIQPGPYFETEFYPAAKSVETARAVVVRNGETLEGIDFAVRARSGVDLYAISAYSFPASVPVPQGFLALSSSRRFLVVSGIGLSTGTGPVPGLSASVIGGSAVVPPGGLQPYAPDPRFVQINLDFHPFSGTGPRHLLFSLNNDIHVRPAGFHLVNSSPPAISQLVRAAAPDGRSAVAIQGQNLSAATRVYFDGVPGVVLNASENTLLVEPPPARSQHRATVVLANQDGQSSWYIHGADSPVFDYEAKTAGLAILSMTSLPAGVEALVEVAGVNTRFAAGRTELGLGSKDVVVRGLWVLGPARLLANVRVGETAVGVWPVTVVDGLEVISAGTLQVGPADGRTTLVAPVRDAATGRLGPYPGGTASVRASRLPAAIAASALSLTVNDQPAAVRSLEGDTILFEVPASVTPGVAVLRLRTSQGEAYPIAFTVLPPPPQVLAIIAAPDQPVGPSRPARPGDLIRLQVARLGEPGEAIGPERVKIDVGGARHAAERVIAIAGRPELHEVQFFLGTSAPAGDAVPLVVLVDGRESLPVTLPVAN